MKSNEDLSSLGIKPAEPRTFIPVEGLWPKLQQEVGPQYDLSAGIQGFEFPFAHGNRRYLSGSLNRLWFRLMTYRNHLVFTYPEQQVIDEKFPGWRQAKHFDVGILAMADNNDNLFEHLLTPVINSHLEQAKRPGVLIPSIGYPVLAWFKDKIDGPLYEADFFGLVKGKKKLPQDIGCVYLDCPGTFWGSKYMPGHSPVVQDWINANPEALFIVDQANLGFDKYKDPAQKAVNDLATLFPQGNSNVIVTNTTTKSFVGTRAVAWAWSSDKFKVKHLGQRGGVLAHFPNASDIGTATTLFYNANLARAAVLRGEIVKKRQLLVHQLDKKYGAGAVLGRRYAVNHSLILDATKFGFTSAETMAQTFAEGAHSEAKPIGLKPTFYYGGASSELLAKCVYIAVPPSDEVFAEVQKAFKLIGVKQ